LGDGGKIGAAEVDAQLGEAGLALMASGRAQPMVPSALECRSVRRRGQSFT
jgi:hypothetical protein